MKTSDDITAYMRYLTKCSRILTKRQEHELARTFRNEDNPEDVRYEARMGLFHSNIRWAFNYASKWRSQPYLSLMELISAANEGLWVATEKYNPDKFDTKLCTYATWWMRNAIQRAFYETHTVCVPENHLCEMDKFKMVEDELYHKLGRPPTSEQLGEALGMKASAVKLRRKAIEIADSTYYSIGAGDSRENGRDNISADSIHELSYEIDQYDTLELSENIEALTESLSSLDERQELAIRMWYGIGCKQATQKVIGNIMGVSKERTRQIIAEGIKHLKVRLEEDFPKLFEFEEAVA